MEIDTNTPTFNKEQLSAYFDHVKLPKEYHGDNVPLDLKFLTALHRHQIAAIPYENLSLHYSQEKTIDLDPQVLYTKFISTRNRGGYCMEGCLFFLHILRSLGFDAYPTVVRIRLRENGVPTGPYVTLTHIILIIELTEGGGSSKYGSDVAFGGDGPTVPIPLREGPITKNLGTQEIRFIRERIPGARKHDFWVYQYRNAPEKPWNSFYAFNETECLDADFRAINFWTSQGPTFQKRMTLVVKFILGQDPETGGEKIVGKLMMVNGAIKRNFGGTTKLVQLCSTEPERIRALKEWFGIELTEEETVAIRGMVSELKGTEVVGA